MNYLDRYVKRVERNGKTARDSKINISKRIEKQAFYTSPSFIVVKVNDVETDSIVNNDTRYDEKQIFFLPDYEAFIGDLVEYKNSKYLINSLYENEVYPKAKMKLCNSTFPLEFDKTKVLIGYDKYDRPVYEDQVITHNEPCIVETKYYFNNRNDQITLPADTVRISMKYQEASNIEMNKEFDLYKSRFHITFIDYSQVINGKGIMSITGERVMNKDGHV